MIPRRLKVILVALLVIQLVIPSPILAAAVGQFVSAVGDVTQTRAGVVSKPQVKSPIQLQDVIVTGDRSSASMIFDDESTISLAPNSKFEVKEFHVKDNTRKGSFFLSFGKLTADVKKFIGGDSSFEVHSPTAVAGVRGTGFEMATAMVGGEMTTTVTCTSGAVTVMSVTAAGVIIAAITIVAGQVAVVSAAGAISISAAAAAAAAGAGAAAGASTVAGVAAGTIAAAAAVTAAVAAVVVVGTSGGGNTATTTHNP
jgi:hypothetical protein